MVDAGAVVGVGAGVVVVAGGSVVVVVVLASGSRVVVVVECPLLPDGDGAVEEGSVAGAVVAGASGVSSPTVKLKVKLAVAPGATLVATNAMPPGGSWLSHPGGVFAPLKVVLGGNIIVHEAFDAGLGPLFVTVTR